MSPPQQPFGKGNLPKQLFINNEYVDSKNRSKLSVYNPADEGLIADDVALAGEADVDAAVASARAAFKTWRNSPADTRRNCLNKLADLTEAHASAISDVTRVSLGQPRAGIGSFDVTLCCNALRYYAGWTDKFAGESYPQDDGFLKITRNEPLGVVAGIVPWNVPTGLIGMKAGPALATGNVFILKPSEKTPFSALFLGSLIKQAGFPPGVFQVLSGDGTTGALLARHPNVQKISFTGSTATGRKIQQMAATSNLKRVTLELGGKSPAIIFDDADVVNAVKWCVQGITINTGQVCMAASKVYVQEGVYDRFVAVYKGALEQAAHLFGDPEAPSSAVGPLVDRIQFEKVTGFIERGRQQGTLAVGGERIGNKGFYIPPTVFENVPDDAEIVRSEIFGPVSTISSFKSEEEIVERANASEFGLMAGVFTQDVTRALRVASDVEAGMVGINAVTVQFMGAPFGGFKTSGVGREGAIDSLRMYTEKKTIFVNMRSGG